MMCGIFAFTGPARPDPLLLTAAAVEAARRGPHGHGWVIRDPAGALSSHHQLGALNGDLDLLARVTGTAVLGHARLATFGAHDDTGVFQPVISDGHAIAHNGNVYNAATLAAWAPTDTHALAAAYAAVRASGLPARAALDYIVAHADQRAWAIVILDADGTLLAHRHYHPLYIVQAAEGTYLSSRPFHPDSQLVAEDWLLSFPGAA